MDSVVKGVIKKFKQLWLPFFVWTAIYVLLHNIFLKVNILTDNPEIFDYVKGEYLTLAEYYSLGDIVRHVISGAFFMCDELLLGPLWFLKVLFMVSVSYLIIDYLTKRIAKNHILPVQLIVSVILLVLGYYCFLTDRFFHGLAQLGSVYCLYFMGHVLSLHKDKYIDLDWKRYLIVFVTSFILLNILNHFGEIELSFNSYENPLFLLVTSISGWAMLYSFSFFIKKISPVKELMTCIGKRTLSIVCLHLLCMKIIAAIIVAHYDLPSFCIAAFPHLYGERGFWWLAYTIIGTAIPVLASMAYGNILSFRLKSAK